MTILYNWLVEFWVVLTCCWHFEGADSNIKRKFLFILNSCPNFTKTLKIPIKIFLIFNLFSNLQKNYKSPKVIFIFNRLLKKVGQKRRVHLARDHNFTKTIQNLLSFFYIGFQVLQKTTNCSKNYFKFSLVSKFYRKTTNPLINFFLLLIGFHNSKKTTNPNKNFLGSKFYKKTTKSLKNSFDFLIGFQILQKNHKSPYQFLFILNWLPNFQKNHKSQ